MPRMFLTIIALLVLVPAFADEIPRASIPYSKLADYQKLMDKMKDQDQLNVTARMRSSDRKVKSSDITVEARLKSGTVVSMPIAADGTFTLPSTPELAQEDPLFVSNLPKGTLGLDVEITIKPPGIKAQRYADLMKGMTQLNLTASRLGSTQAPKAYGVLFAFHEGSHTLTLHTRKGDKVLRSETREKARKRLKANQLPNDDTVAFIYVAMEDQLLKENPQTSFDVLPVEVVPAL